MGIDAAPPSADPALQARPRLSGAELAVLKSLIDAGGKVIGRREIARQAGLTDQSERRCDAVMVTLRRVLGEGSIVTVRRRGWRIEPSFIPFATTFTHAF
jgi:DNA-binding winged helix-turn-helix (wHTH) protein